MAPIHFGALVYEYQAIDVVGPFDLVNSSGKAILEYVKNHGAIPQRVYDAAPEFVFHHIGETREPVTLLSSGFTILPTDTVESCPEVDCLLLGGPVPEGFEYPPSYVEFIKRHVASGKPLFTTCTGAGALASTGLLDGRHATVNNVEYNYIKKAYPKVKWTREKKWIVDGNIWTGAGAVAGMDMFAHWIKENWGMEVMVAGAMGLDYEPRDIDGRLNVIPLRYNTQGDQIYTHVFP